MSATSTARRAVASALAGAMAMGVDASSGAAPPAPAARPFAAITASKAQLAAWRAQICARPEAQCGDVSGVDLYRAPSDPQEVAWAIVASGPALLELRRADGGWTVQRRWDFSRYVHSQVPRVLPDSLSPARIYPALYPLGLASWAVAMVVDIREMYSGGGALFTVADFVPLGAPEDLPAATYAGVPFSCSKTVRACFTEEEYKRSSKCSDDFNGFLTLSYGPAAAAPASRYAWTAVWHEGDWPPDTPKAKATSTRYTVPLPADRAASAAFDDVPFCDTGPARSDP